MVWWYKVYDISYFSMIMRYFWESIFRGSKNEGGGEEGYKNCEIIVEVYVYLVSD